MQIYLDYLASIKHVTFSRLLMTITPYSEIILCTHNSSLYISRCLKSILPSLSSNLRLFIVDDCSEDDTVNIIKGILESSPGSEHVFLTCNNINLGLTLNLINHINSSSAYYIFRMDSDDICSPDRFQVQLSYAIENPSIDIIGSNAYVIDKTGRFMHNKFKPVSPQQIHNKLHTNPFIHSSVVFKRSSYLEVGGYNATLRHGQDYELWFRCAKKGLNMANIPLPLIYLRHSNRLKYPFSSYLRELIIGLRGSASNGLHPLSYIELFLRFFYCIISSLVLRFKSH